MSKMRQNGWYQLAINTWCKNFFKVSSKNILTNSVKCVTNLSHHKFLNPIHKHVHKNLQIVNTAKILTLWFKLTNINNRAEVEHNLAYCAIKMLWSSNLLYIRKNVKKELNKGEPSKEGLKFRKMLLEIVIEIKMKLLQGKGKTVRMLEKSAKHLYQKMLFKSHQLR